MLHALVLLATLQQQQAVTARAPGIAKVTIQPAEVAVQVGDTVRLVATATDSAGRRMRDVTVAWFQAGGRFEGKIDSTGLVSAGSVGSMTVSALVAPRAGGSPTTAFARVTILPRPASRIAVEPAVSRLYAGQSVTVVAEPFSPDGDRRQDEVVWTSDAPAVVAVAPGGRLIAGKPGRATVTAKAGRATQALAITVAANPVSAVRLEPASASLRTGDVLRLAFHAQSSSGGAVADAMPEWSLSPGNAQVEHDGTFVADLPGTYRVVATFAGKSAEASVQVRPRDVRRPATLVGRLSLPVNAAEFWLHPGGRYGYLTTMGDKAYAIDLGDPTRPAITDSVVVDARHINDLMTTEDGKFGVLTRENASTRKNGIVILSFEDPAHPKPIAEFTETVTGGVHSTFIYKGYIYLTDDATGSLRVIDIRDPVSSEAGGAVGDAVQQGGELRARRGCAGWARVSQLLERRAHHPRRRERHEGRQPRSTRSWSPSTSTISTRCTAKSKRWVAPGSSAARIPRGVTASTSSWATKSSRRCRGIPRASGVVALGRAYGRLHVVDVSDITKPRAVAYYEPKDGGAHNVWVAGDTLYMGDYQGGLRVVDISGELRGDLLRQGREIAHVVTADGQGVRPNAPNTWGALYRNGLIYAPDINTGLWVVRVESKSELTP